jgi:biotin synthase-related radical SAM superfamily protein
MLVRNLKIKDSNLETLSRLKKSLVKIEEVKQRFFDCRDASELLNMSTKTIYRNRRKEINSFSFSVKKTHQRKDIDAYFDNNLRD